MKLDLEDVAMWSFMGAMYAFACSCLIGISIALECAHWPAKLFFGPLWLATVGIWIFLSIMLGQRIYEDLPQRWRSALQREVKP
jgi:membrane-associated PAP2 superfamily phosphatase